MMSSGDEDALLAADFEDGAGQVAVNAPVVVDVGGGLVVGQGVVEQRGVGLPLPHAGGLLNHLVGDVLAKAGLVGPGVARAVPLVGFLEVVEADGRGLTGHLGAEGLLAALGADVYDDDAFHHFGVGVGVEEGVPAAHRKAGEDALGDAVGFDEGGEVIDEALAGVAVDGPAAAAVPPLVEGVDVEVGGHGLGEFVPDVGLAGVAVHADEGRVAGRAPIEVAEADAVEGDEFFLVGDGHFFSP